MNNRPGSAKWNVFQLNGRRIAIACSLLLAVGCGSGRPGQVSVAGQVTVDGKPVTEGRIEFYPVSGRPATGSIDSEGRYKLGTYDPGDGAKPGEYRVTITSRIIPEEGPVYNSFEDEMMGNMQKPAGEKPQRITWVVPRRYSQRSTSDLEVVISADAADVDFHLQSKP